MQQNHITAPGPPTSQPPVKPDDAESEKPRLSKAENIAASKAANAASKSHLKTVNIKGEAIEAMTAAVIEKNQEKNDKVLGVSVYNVVDDRDMPCGEDLRTGTRKQYGDSLLVVLDGNSRKTPGWHGVRCQVGCIGFIRTGENSETLIPTRTNPQDELGNVGHPDIVVEFDSIDNAPGIRMKFKLFKDGPMNDRVLHTGSIGFYFGALWDQQRKGDYRGIVPGSYKAICNPDDFSMEISFRSQGAVAFNYSSPSHHSLTPAESALYDQLDQFVNNKDEMDVKLRLVPFKNDLKTLEASRVKDVEPDKMLRSHILAQSLMSTAKESPVRLPAFWNYKSTATSSTGSNTVPMEYDQTLSRWAVVTRTPHAPFVAFPNYWRFLDCRHAALTLGNGMLNEFEETKRRSIAIRQNDHVCSYLLINQIIMIFVKFSCPPRIGFGENEHFRLPTDTKIALEIEDGGSQENAKVTGVVTENTLQLPDTDLTIVVGRRSDVDTLRGTASKFNETGTILHRYHLCTLEADISSTVIKAQIDAISRVYDPVRVDGTHGAHLDLLLFDGTKHDTTKPFECVGDAVLTKTAQEFMLNPFPKDPTFKWNESQLEVMKASQRLTCRASLVTGCGGSGKTMIMIVKAYTAAYVLKQYSLVTSQMNSVLDHLALTLSKTFPDPDPLRVYAKTKSLAQLSKETSHDPKKVFTDPKVNEEEVALYELLYANYIASDSKRRVLEHLSVEGHVKKLLAGSTKIMAHFMDGETLSGIPKPHQKYPEKQDMLAFMRVFLKDVAIHPLNARIEEDYQELPNYWSDEHLRLVQQALDCCRQYVILNAKVVLTTLSNCASEEVRKFFAPSTKRSVFHECDEAFTASEANMLIPFGTMAASSRIVSHSLYGDTKQLSLIVLGQTKTFNSDWPGMNEFGTQIRTSLMGRLISAGFPLEHLTEQCRMSPIIFAPSNAFFYEDSVTTKADANFDLPTGWHKLICDVRGDVTDETCLTPEQERLLWIEVPDGDVHRAATGSKGNWATFNKVMSVIKGPFHELFGSQMRSKVTILVPYTRQRALYAAAFVELRSKHGWKGDDLPRLTTVDSAIGTECMHAIVDLAIDSLSPHGQGFLKDARRICVLMTRAKLSLFVCTGISSDADPAPSKYERTKLSKDGEVISGNALSFFMAYFRKRQCVI